MFFLLRMAFWLGLVLMLLPTDKTPDADKGPKVDAAEAVTAASAAVSDMAQFCNRQPTACAVGGQAASVVGARVQAGARKAIQFFTDKIEKTDKPDTAEKSGAVEKTAADSEPAKKAVMPKRVLDKKNPDHTGSIGSPDDADASGAAVPHDTLTPDDLSIEWQPPF